MIIIGLILRRDSLLNLIIEGYVEGEFGIGEDRRRNQYRKRKFLRTYRNEKLSWVLTEKQAESCSRLIERSKTIIRGNSRRPGDQKKRKFSTNWIWTCYGQSRKSVRCIITPEHFWGNEIRCHFNIQISPTLTRHSTSARIQVGKADKKTAHTYTE